MTGIVTREYLVYFGRGGQGRLRAEARGGERTRGARPAEGLLVLAALEERDEQAGGEGVAGCGAVDGVDGGGSARATSSPSSSSTAPSAPSVSATSPSRRFSASSS